MTKHIKKLTIVAGVVVAFMAAASIGTLASNLEVKNAFYEVIAIDIEALKAVEAKINADIPEDVTMPRIRVYNNDFKLIYECRDQQDQRLRKLLRCGNLIMNTDSSSYYLIGD